MSHTFHRHFLNDCDNMSQVLEFVYLTYENGLSDSILTKLSRPVIINEREEWSVALKEITLSTTSTTVEEVYLNLNVINEVYVNDTTAPILRRIPKADFGDDVRYDDPFYIPLNLKYFDTLEINIRNEKGRQVSLENVMVKGTLHFRKITSWQS